MQNVTLVVGPACGEDVDEYLQRELIITIGCIQASRPSQCKLLYVKLCMHNSRAERLAQRRGHMYLPH